MDFPHIATWGHQEEGAVFSPGPDLVDPLRPAGALAGGFKSEPGFLEGSELARTNFHYRNRNVSGVGDCCVRGKTEVVAESGKEVGAGKCQVGLVEGHA